MKKSIALILALVVALGCAVVFKNCGMEKAPKAALTKCYEGLYKLQETEPDYQAAEKVLAQASAFRSSIGSAMATGAFAGYNFDYNENLDTYIIQTEAKGGKFALIGVAHADTSKGLQAAEDGASDGISAAALNALLTDGINDHGVFVCLLSMTDVNNTVADGTNPGAPVKMNFLLTVRYLLECSQSALEAASELRELNLYTTEEGCGYHLLIADEEKAFVAELVDNMLVITEDRRELTNYCISRTTSTIARGTERNTVLHKINELVSSRWGMMKTMESVWPTKVFDAEANNRWYSEFYGTYPEYTDDEGNPLEFNSGTAQETADAILDKIIAQYAEDPTGFYKNIHSSVYDFATGTLSIRVNESPVELKFSLNIQPPAPVEESLPEDSEADAESAGEAENNIQTEE